MKRVVWSVFALALLLALVVSATPNVAAHPAQSTTPPPQANVCAPSMSLSTPALKAHLIKTLGAEGVYLVSKMKQRFIPDPATQCQIGKPVDSGNSLAGQAAPGALTDASSTTSAHTLQSGTCCQVTNPRWGGYYIDETGAGTSTNGVQANFNAEFVSCSVCSMYSWVGVGGVNGSPSQLDQVGVNMRSDKHFAFWCAYNQSTGHCQETGTASPSQLFNVSQGDNIFGYVARYGVGVWEFLVEDTTNGGYSDLTYAWSPNATTADWITELSVSQNGYVPQFNDITYSDDYWYDSNGNPKGAIHDINDNKTIDGVECFPNQGVIPAQYAEPKSVYAGGTAFTYYWGA